MTLFYEEEFDDGCYNEAMIEELFDKQKVRFNRKSQYENFGSYFMNAGSLKESEQSEYSTS